MMMRVVALALSVLLLLPTAARADYKYAAADAEYVIALPDAPLGETIWAQDGRVPILDSPPKYGAVGEYALYRKVDPHTGDLFEVRVTFVKADRDFLLNLKRETVEATLNRLFLDQRLQNRKFSMSRGTSTLKWGILSGYSTSINNDMLHNVAHYLAGEQTVQIVRIVYSTQNKKFAQDYQDLVKSITYMGQ
jgi:hypothetical protein